MNTPITTKPGVTPIPPGWRWAHLTDVAKLESGHTPSRRNAEYWGGDIPWLSLKDMQSLTDLRIFDTADKPTMLGIDNSSARLLPAGTVALCRTASVGKVAILGRQMATSQDFVNWICGPDLDNEYLYWALRCSSASFDIEKQGSTHKTIYMPTLERLHVMLPPPSVQRQISQIFGRVETLRRKRQEAISLTEQLLRSTFLEMFGDPVDNPKKFPKTSLGRLMPDHGSIVDGPFGSSLKPDCYAAKGVRVIRNYNIKDDAFDSSEFKYVTSDKYQEIQRSNVSPGDILMSTKGTLGNICIMPPLPGEAVLSASGSVRLRLPGKTPILAEFLVQQMIQASYKAYIHQFEGGSIQKYLNLSSIRKMEVYIPPLENQHKFASLRAHIKDFRAKAELAASTADNLFNSLVQRAFTGQL